MCYIHCDKCVSGGGDVDVVRGRVVRGGRNLKPVLRLPTQQLVATVHRDFKI